MIREIVREVAGYTNYERRMMEMIRVGSSASYKKALVLAKSRLGTRKRAKAKREEVEEMVQALRRKEEHHEEHKEEAPKDDKAKPTKA